MIRALLPGILALAVGFGVGNGLRPAAAPPDDLGARALQALSLPERNARMRAWLSLLEQVEPADAGPLADLLVTKRVAITHCETQPFVRAMLARDFDASMRIVQKWGDANPNEEGLQEIARSLTLEGNLSEARDLARTRRATRRREALVEGLVGAWAETGDLDALARYLHRRPEGGELRNLIDPALRGILRRYGPEAAVAWVDALPDDDTPNGLARGSFLMMLRLLMIRDPQQGLAWYEENIERPRARSGRNVVASEWFEHDPEAASNWLLTQPDDLESRTALFAGIERWLEIAPDAGEHWLSANIEHPLAKAGIRPLVEHIAYDRPLEAIEWSQRIPDEDQRDRTLGRVLRTWHERDAAATQAWIASQPDGLPIVTLRSAGIAKSGPPPRKSDSSERRQHDDP